VALKVLLAVIGAEGDIADEAARLRDEAAAAGKLRHPGLVSVLDAGDDPAVGPYVVYEYMSRGTLRDRLSDCGPLGWSEAARLVGRPLFAALAALHDHGVVHRDVKPENLLAGDDGTYKLGDFGLAHFGGRSARTATGLVVGTPGYVAPEAFVRGAGRPGPEADLYAAAVTMVEAATGRLPFDVAGSGSRLQAQLHSDVPARRLAAMGCPPAWTALLSRLLSRRPGDRVADGRQVTRMLTRDGPPRPSERRRVLTAVALTVAAAAAVFGSVHVLTTYRVERMPPSVVVAPQAGLDGAFADGTELAALRALADEAVREAWTATKRRQVFARLLVGSGPTSYRHRLVTSVACRTLGDTHGAARALDEAFSALRAEPPTAASVEREMGLIAEQFAWERGLPREALGRTTACRERLDEPTVIGTDHRRTGRIKAVLLVLYGRCMARAGRVAEVRSLAPALAAVASHEGLVLGDDPVFLGQLSLLADDVAAASDRSSVDVQPHPTWWRSGGRPPAGLAPAVFTAGYGAFDAWAGSTRGYIIGVADRKHFQAFRTQVGLDRPPGRDGEGPPVVDTVRRFRWMAEAALAGDDVPITTLLASSEQQSDMIGLVGAESSGGEGLGWGVELVTVIRWSRGILATCARRLALVDGAAGPPRYRAMRDFYTGACRWIRRTTGNLPAEAAAWRTFVDPLPADDPTVLAIAAYALLMQRSPGEGYGASVRSIDAALATMQPASSPEQWDWLYSMVTARSAMGRFTEHDDDGALADRLAPLSAWTDVAFPLGQQWLRELAVFCRANGRLTGDRPLPEDLRAELQRIRSSPPLRVRHDTCAAKLLAGNKLLATDP